MKKTKSLFYEMRMCKTHVIVVYISIRTLREANDLSLTASSMLEDAILLSVAMPLLWAENHAHCFLDAWSTSSNGQNRALFLEGERMQR